LNLKSYELRVDLAKQKLREAELAVSEHLHGINFTMVRHQQLCNQLRAARRKVLKELNRLDEKALEGR
jgi:hypothetical protein